ncbi:MAG: L-fucose isomerase [candidate division TA06 bacterium ADurb.Bin417]|uniref:L-fucose isomerase n=1 Tax=candidate division TA06 bacterium ADurb.Bin417 TaxID=1852828 RepID=A0A1V5MAZ1_UNCT6|nr:MAG: L-fucose isomerase [candidate division TA06 bacterium ADurb.Bin417]
MKGTRVGLVLINDEREHVYRSNEAESLKVVRAWADFIGREAVNLDGSRVETVCASETVKSVRTAQKLGAELAAAGCQQVIFIYNVWCFPFLVWPFLNSFGRDKPILSLSNNSGEFPGNVGLLATDGALRQAGFRTHRLVGDQADPATRAAVLAWVRASQAVTTIRNEVFGAYGGPSMGMDTGYFHLVPNLKTLGTSVQFIDQLWLVEKMKEVSEAEVEAGFAWFGRMLGNRILYDGKMLTPETLKTQLRLYLAMEAVNRDKGFDFCGLKGQRELTEYVCLGDIPEMLMNDPYDWRGPKEPMVCATEADAYAALTMQLLKYLSGGRPTLFMDVRLYHPDLDLWDFCNSGNHSTYYAALSTDPAVNYRKVTFFPALEYYFKAGGASMFYDAAPGRLTFARLGLWDDRPFLVIVPGESVELPAANRKRLDDQTNPTWPHVHARLECGFEEFKTVFPANHILAVAGDHVSALVYAAEILGIPPVLLGPAAAGRVRPIWERV